MNRSTVFSINVADLHNLENTAIHSFHFQIWANSAKTNINVLVHISELVRYLVTTAKYSIS